MANERTRKLDKSETLVPERISKNSAGLESSDRKEVKSERVEASESTLDTTRISGGIDKTS